MVFRNQSKIEDVTGVTPQVQTPDLLVQNIYKEDYWKIASFYSLTWGKVGYENNLQTSFTVERH